MSQKTIKISSSNSNKYYRNFIDSCKSDATKDDYQKGLGYFMDYLKINSGDYAKLIDSKKEDIKLIEADIIKWITYLKDKEKLSPASINLYTAAVKHFYSINDITLNTKKINKFKPAFRNVVEDQPYTREQIRRLLDEADVSMRNRAIILLLVSSGMRVGALKDLKIKDLKPIDKYNIYQITVYKRSNVRYTTFCSTECRKELDDYFAYRERYKEKVKLNPDSPVFRRIFDHVDKKIAASDVRPISTVGIRTMINDLLDKTGVRRIKHVTKSIHAKHPSNHTELMELHGFRKFFTKACMDEGGMSEFYTNCLLGHNTRLIGRYNRTTPEQLLEGNDKNPGYKDVMENLIIREENRLRKQLEGKPKIESLQKRIAELEGQTIKLQEDQAMTQKLALANTLVNQEFNELNYIKDDNERRKRIQQLLNDGAVANPIGYYDKYMKELEKWEKKKNHN